MGLANRLYCGEAGDAIDEAGVLLLREVMPQPEIDAVDEHALTLNE
jgi:hypothetical protein